MKQPYVSTLIEQDFSEEEKAIARENIEAISSADLGAYATKTWVSDNFLSDADFREFVTEEELISATSGKMDATEASAFYPRYSNPEGYLTSIPSEYVTESELDAAVSGKADRSEIPDVSDFTTHSEVESAILSATSGKMDQSESANFYPRYSNPEGYINSIPSEYVTEDELASATSAFVTSAGLSAALDPYATKQYVSSVAQGISNWATGEFYPLSNPSHFITSADVPAQIEYSAGQNVSINNHVISATDTTYSAGTGLSLNGTTFNNTAPNVKSDWNAAAGSDAEILNKPSIPSKTSELQNDSGFITSASIPTVNNATLTIQKNGSSVATFTANSSVNVSANLSIPTDTSDLTNGAGFITSAAIPSTDDLVLISVGATTPYTDVADAFSAGKTPVLYYAYQDTIQYFWFIRKTTTSYIFAAVTKGNFGNIVTEYTVNNDNTVTNGSQTSAKRFSVNDETLTIDNGELKWKYPALSYFGQVTSRGGNVSWVSDMTSSQFNRKLVDMPVPSAGYYMVMFNGIGRFVDPVSSAGSPALLFRVCMGDGTQSFSTIAGQWQFTESSSNSKYTGFSGFTMANLPSNYISNASLNVSNNDYAPPAGSPQTFYWTELRVAWFRLPQ